jgi:hypothetical protein
MAGQSSSPQPGSNGTNARQPGGVRRIVRALVQSNNQSASGGSAANVQQQAGQGSNTSGGQLSSEQLTAAVRAELERLGIVPGNAQGAGTQAQGASGQNGAGGSNADGSGSSSQTSQTAQQVAQILGQAQAEIAQELEANLKQLRQVISQSEAVARKIERVLGQSGTSSQQSS